jgi:hypothetical protein
MECTVRSWMYTSITLDLLSGIMTSDASTHRVWLPIEDQFIGNKETRAFILDAEFHNFVQGDRPIVILELEEPSAMFYFERRLRISSPSPSSN